jgi:hypothetical protein
MEYLRSQGWRYYWDRYKIVPIILTCMAVPILFIPLWIIVLLVERYQKQRAASEEQILSTPISTEISEPLKSMEKTSNLTTCKDCSQTVSKQAALCPNCGVIFPGHVRSPIWSHLKVSLACLEYRARLKKAAVVASRICAAGAGLVITALILTPGEVESEAYVIVPVMTLVCFFLISTLVWIGLLLHDLARELKRLKMFSGE